MQAVQLEEVIEQMHPSIHNIQLLFVGLGVWYLLELGILVSILGGQLVVQVWSKIWS